MLTTAMHQQMVNSVVAGVMAINAVGMAGTQDRISGVAKRHCED